MPEWSVQMAARESAGWSVYRVGLRRVPLVADQEPNDTPLAAVKLPLNGDISGRVGGFDAVDQIMVPLPEGEGGERSTEKDTEERRAQRGLHRERSTQRESNQS